MAEQLKLFFDRDRIEQIAEMLKGAHSEFDTNKFCADASKGLEELELMQRAEHIARAMIKHLPDDPEKLFNIIVASLPPVEPVEENHPFSSFIFAPHTYVIRMRGLHHFDAAMRANYEVTQRFTAEFSVRPFIEHYPKKALALLKKWTRDPSHHVRRLVSEGLRPRLPWAARLKVFDDNPQPIVDMLELLKDDVSLYVRRSVANNLNDIGKDHPDVLLNVAREWLNNATAQRTWLVHHALRSAVKRGDPEVLNLLGYGAEPVVEFQDVVMPKHNVEIGTSVRLAFTIVNPTKQIQNTLVDLRVLFLKANGELYPKVFKLGTAELLPGASATFKKTVSVRQHTTRTHYPGKHLVEAQINGKIFALGAFTLIEA